MIISHNIPGQLQNKFLNSSQIETVARVERQILSTKVPIRRHMEAHVGQNDYVLEKRKKGVDWKIKCNNIPFRSFLIPLTTRFTVRIVS